MRQIAIALLLIVLMLSTACGPEEVSPEIERTPPLPTAEPPPTAPETTGYPGPSVDQQAEEATGYPGPSVDQESEATAGYPAPPPDEFGAAEPTGYPEPGTGPTEPSEQMSEQDLDLDEANVMFVTAVQTTDGAWGFEVTVRHNDEGWDHYADGWDVVTPDGTVLKTNPDDEFTRVLLHPHDNEQPFTREQSGLTIPDDVTEVTVRAHCNVHDFGGRDVVVDLTADRGPDFEIQRQQ